MQERSNTTAATLAAKFAPAPSRRQFVAGGAVAAAAVLAGSAVPADELDRPMQTGTEAVQQVRAHLTEALRLHRGRKATDAAFQVKFHALVKDHRSEAFALEDERLNRFPVSEWEDRAVAVPVTTPDELMAKLALLAGYAAAKKDGDFLDWYGERLAQDVRAAISPAQFD